MYKPLALLVAGVACAFSAGTGIAAANVSAQDVQQMISDQLAPKLGVTPDSVACPGDLATDVGAALTCQVTVGGETHAVRISVAEVDPAGRISVSIAPA